jgi:heme-degrading monooxygenase HmoA
MDGLNKCWRSLDMYIAIAQFPKISEGKEADFLEWFAWSNEEFSKLKGFIRRRLLQPQGGGNYVVLIEFDTFEDFKVVGESPFHSVSAKRVAPLLEGKPVPASYVEVMG